MACAYAAKFSAVSCDGIASSVEVAPKSDPLASMRRMGMTFDERYLVGVLIIILWGRNKLLVVVTTEETCDDGVSN